jgi:hypothetical protein
MLHRNIEESLMSAGTQQYIDLMGSETETLSAAIAVHLMDSIDSCSIFMQCLALYNESKQLVKFIKKNDADTVIDPDDAMTDVLTRCQEKIKLAYNKMGDFMEGNRTRFINPMDKIMIPLSRWLLKKSFDNHGLAIIHIMEHDVDADKSPYSEPFGSIDDLMKHLNS